MQKIIPLLSFDKLPPGCFPSGTSLLTSAGDQLIETLTPGAELVTIRVNGPNLRPIIRVTTHRIQPALIRIRAHAFAPDMPARDLVLSGEHAIYADGALFQLADLCNGISIFPEPAQPALLYRIELDAHDVILAEGLPVVFGLVEEMSGTITLASAPGAGTTVSILIPCAGTAGDVDEEAAQAAGG